MNYHQQEAERIRQEIKKLPEHNANMNNIVFAALVRRLSQEIRCSEACQCQHCRNMNISIRMPVYRQPVLATLQHFESQTCRQAVLERVNADDHDFEFIDGDEIAWEWNVIFWKYI